MTTKLGRPKGLPKSGGRKAGTPNKLNAEKEAAIAASGLTPLDYMLSLLRDEGESKEVRVDVAKAAAPYCHARLQQTAMTVGVTQKLEDILLGIIK